MDIKMIETFITVLAWIGAIGGTGLAGIVVWLSYDYHCGGKDGGASIEKLIHNLEGREAVFRPMKFIVIAVLSWAWLITSWVS